MRLKTINFVGKALVCSKTFTYRQKSKFWTKELTFLFISICVLGFPIRPVDLVNFIFNANSATVLY